MNTTLATYLRTIRKENRHTHRHPADRIGPYPSNGGSLSLRQVSYQQISARIKKSRGTGGIPPAPYQRFTASWPLRSLNSAGVPPLGQKAFRLEDIDDFAHIRNSKLFIGAQSGSRVCRNPVVLA